jgi:3-oxoacyl-[acyl-carrier-protein] synthase II
MASRVVITGIGPVANGGIGKDDLFNHVWSRRCNATPVPGQFTRSYPLRSRWYVPLPQFSLADYGIHLLHENIMQAADRMAVLGARLALDDAGLAPATTTGSIKFAGVERAGVILGTGLGSLRAALESNVCHCVPREVLQAALPERRLAFNRMVVPNTMPNSPAAWVSICFGLSGSCHTVNASCASGTYAIGEAFRRIKDGYDLLMLAGGVESFQNPDGFMMRGFDVLGVMTQSKDGLPRPFSRNRSGFLFAEGGACLLVLEELQHALSRGARIYAEITDFRSNSDASSIVQMDSTGAAIVRLLRELSGSRKIDYLNTHGTGTAANDQIEANAILNVFGGPAQQPWINSTKGVLGHTLGASGAFEAAVTALSLERSTVHGNLTDDPVADLRLPIENVAGRIENALSVSYGFGGHNGGLLLSRCEPPSHRPAPPVPQAT